MQDRIQAVRFKVAELARKANQLYDITLPIIDLRFDLKGRSAGQAGYKHGKYYMRFNLEMMRGSGWDHIINNTVAHETAHIVCFFKPSLGRDHDHGWRQVCIQLGGNGDRCYSEEVVYGKGRTYEYTTSTGHVVQLSETRHRRVQQGHVYGFRNIGRVDRTCQHRIVGVSGRVINRATAQVSQSATTVAPASATPATPPLIAPVTTARGKVTNAARVRARIAEAKRNGEDQEAVIQWCVTVLGQTRQLARNYLKFNWSRV